MAFLSEAADRRRRVLTQSAVRGAPARIQIALWALLLLLSLFLSVRGYSSYQVGTYRDDAIYISLAQSLVYGSEYGLYNAPNESPVSHFPFGYPLILAPILFFTSNSFTALQYLSLLASLVNGSLIFWGWRWFSQRTSYWWALAVAALYLTSPHVLGQSRAVMSEAIFTTFTLTALLLTEKGAGGAPSRWWSIGLGLALLGAAMTRSVGWILVGSVLLYLLFVRGVGFWREIGLVGACIGALLVILIGLTALEPRDVFPFAYVNQVTRGSPNGVNSKIFDDPEYRITQNMATDVRYLILPGGATNAERALADPLGIPRLWIVLGFGVAAVIALGFYYWYRQEGLSVMLLFPILYLAVLFGLWVWQGSRLLFPIQPQLEFSFLLGIAAIASRLPFRTESTAQRASNAILLAVVFFMLLVSVFQSWKIDDSRHHIGELAARSSWLKSNARPDEILMSEEPQTDFLYSGRKTVGFPDTSASAEQLNRYLGRQTVDYVLIAPQLQWQAKYTPSYSRRTRELLARLAELVAQQRVTLVYSSEQELIQVYRVNR